MPLPHCKMPWLLLALALLCGQSAAAQSAHRPHGTHGRPASAAEVQGQPPRDEVLWLYDRLPPADAAQSWGGRMSMGEMMGDGNRAPTRRLWLLQGASPMQASAVQAQGAALLLDAAQQPSMLSPEDGQPAWRVAFELPQPGYYNVAFVRQSVAQGVRLVQAAKTVLARPAGHGARDNAVDHVLRTDARLPLEIVRQPKAEEGLYTRLNYGDALVYQVLWQGKPLAGALLTLTTGQGWRNSQGTDAEGKARFTLVRDYFVQDWHDFDRNHREPLLATAVWQDEQPGQWGGEPYARTRYVATLSESYAPSVRDYKSYAWGLLVSLLVALFAGAAVYLYRRRRIKPYREEAFRE